MASWLLKLFRLFFLSFAAALWPYSGKRYVQLFPPPQHNVPQQSPHMAPPGPPPMPPPSYEEDQAAARGYVYAPYPYAYPGQVCFLSDISLLSQWI
jgi:hypothetical protein